jgi:ferrochelatase
MRSKKSEANYLEIGGGSPLLGITEAQAEALQGQLSAQNTDIQVYVGMRYWHPFTEEAIDKIKKDKIEKLVILPLYPQFSISTSGSSFRVLEEMWRKDAHLQNIEYTLIPSWYDHPQYLQAMANSIKEELQQFENPDKVHIFFSAHGVPKTYVTEAGDPYQEEIEACTESIMKTLNTDNTYTLAYQSKVGPVEWLKPYTEDALQELGANNVKDLLVVPISFVSEHIETLQEIDLEYREVAEEVGIKNFKRVPALNTDPIFISALTDLTISALEKTPLRFDEVTHPKKNMKMYPPEKWEWGLTSVAEVWNGRLAMLGFLALLAELISGHGPLHLVGLL